MSEFVFVGSSLLEGKLMDFFGEKIKTEKVNQMNALIMNVKRHKFNFNTKIEENLKNEKELVIPKCEIEQIIKIPLDEILLSKKDYFGVVSTSELFKNICQFLTSNNQINDYGEFKIILISGSYFSKHLR